MSYRNLAIVLSNKNNHADARRSAFQALFHAAKNGSQKAIGYLPNDIDLSEPCPCQACRSSHVSVNDMQEHQVTGSPQARNRSTGYTVNGQ